MKYKADFADSDQQGSVGCRFTGHMVSSLLVKTTQKWSKEWYKNV
jgi:hypothetical protein